MSVEELSKCLVVAAKRAKEDAKRLGVGKEVFLVANSLPCEKNLRGLVPLRSLSLLSTE